MSDEKRDPHVKKMCAKEITKKNGDDKDFKNVRNAKRGDE